MKNHGAGETLESTAADGTEPQLSELIDASADVDVEVFQDFSWWIPEGAPNNPAIQQSLQAANQSVVATHPVGADISGTAFWSAGGDKSYIRWVRPTDDESAFLNAIARVAAREEMNLGEGTKFAGVFRTHGVIAPVFDLPSDADPASFESELQRVDAALESEIANDAQLSADERKQLQNLKSRQVTLR